MKERLYVSQKWSIHIYCVFVSPDFLLMEENQIKIVVLRFLNGANCMENMLNLRTRFNVAMHLSSN